MASLYHHKRRKSNINGQENTAEKTFHFLCFFWQTDEIRQKGIFAAILKKRNYV